MTFRRNLIDTVVRIRKVRLFIRQSYWSVLKFEEHIDALPVNATSKLNLSQAKRSYLHYEIARNIARELKVVSHLNELGRYGGNHDGGYVMVEPMEINLSVLSLGVGKDVSWDERLSSNAHTIHLYDHTVECLPSEISIATHFKTEVGSKSKPNTVTLKECINRLPKSDDYILKIDIEGSEWEVLDEVDARMLEQFSQIIVEFHDLHKHIVNLQVSRITKVLSKMRIFHDVVNFHPNNFGDFEIIGNHPIPDIFEVTYLRRDLVVSNHNEFGANFNSPNTNFHPDVILNFP